MKRYVKTGFLFAGMVIVIVLLNSCAQKDIADRVIGDNPYGFWSGLLHGFIAPFDFIGMLFTDHIVMYAPHNNGTWYAFGFLLGSGGWGFLGNKGAKFRRKSRREYGSAEVLEP